MLKDRLLRPSLVTVSKGEAVETSDLGMAGDEMDVGISESADNSKRKLIDGDI
jgi:hypothetical protein